MAENKEKRYVSDNAQLMAEWDWEKNSDFDPTKLTLGSNKKVWWICEKGHEYQTSIAHRTTRGSGCPICSGKKILIGFNDLATTHPNLAREWDYEKNTEISPFDVSKGSEAKVWWKCRANHSWQAAVYSRAAGIGCPQCSRGFQSSFPEKAVYFYVKRIFHDAVANYQSEQINSLELDVFVPSLQIGVEYDGERWHNDIEKDLRKDKICAENGIVLIRIREPKCPILLDGLSICIYRENKKTGLDNTINQLFLAISKITGVEYSVDVNFERDSSEIFDLLNPVEKENSVQFCEPKLVKEWDYVKNGALMPNMVMKGSDRKVWWICDRGHSYQASISSRMRGRGCSICSGKKVLKGYNDFESRCPELAKEWDYNKNMITPDSVAYGSDKKYWWICDRGHSYMCSINNRRAGQKCPYCFGKRVLAGFNDISTTYPDIAKQWCDEKNELKPTEVTAGSHKKVWWKCDVCGYEWTTYVYNRCLYNATCPKCRGKVK